MCPDPQVCPASQLCSSLCTPLRPGRMLLALSEGDIFTPAQTGRPDHKFRTTYRGKLVLLSLHPSSSSVGSPERDVLQGEAACVMLLGTSALLTLKALQGSPSSPLLQSSFCSQFCAALVGQCLPLKFHLAGSHAIREPSEAHHDKAQVPMLFSSQCCSALMTQSLCAYEPALKIKRHVRACEHPENAHSFFEREQNLQPAVEGSPFQ
mmetsp:Transcript_143313/g.275271  ORF Transcript_143313/g.275271 Transcript_143313/m.275271 type:complete len:208 (+) Transcript_143313:208-831(+)